MNERLEIFLEAPTVTWDNVKGVVQPVAISTFVDCQGGVWNVKDNITPCGIKAEMQSNPYRIYWYCEKHPGEGVLILQYRGNVWCWMSGKEVTKK